MSKKTDGGFWARVANRDLSDHHAMHFEPDERVALEKFEREIDRVFSAVDLSGDEAVLDVGAGVGLWAVEWATRVREVTAVEKESVFVRRMERKVAELGLVNVECRCMSTEELECLPNNWYDIVFLSGITIYLDDCELNQVAVACRSLLRPSGVVVHRDSYGMGGRYEIERKPSAAIGDLYSAVYRSRQEYDAAFLGAGFELRADCDMYPSGSVYNKWDETRLRLAVYSVKG